jgi:hypothetical protein
MSAIPLASDPTALRGDGPVRAANRPRVGRSARPAGQLTPPRTVARPGCGRNPAALFQEALTVSSELEGPWVAPRALSGLASIARLEADYARAARLFGAAEALREASGTHEQPQWSAVFERNLADVRAALGDEALSATLAEGRAMSLEQAVGYANRRSYGRHGPAV